MKKTYGAVVIAVVWAEAIRYHSTKMSQHERLSSASHVEEVGLQPPQFQTFSRSRPMAPARSSARRSAHGPQVPPSGQHAQNENLVANKELFIDPMLGTALAIYIEKDVDDKETISDLIVVSHSRVELSF